MLLINSFLSFILQWWVLFKLSLIFRTVCYRETDVIVVFQFGAIMVFVAESQNT